MMSLCMSYMCQIFAEYGLGEQVSKSGDMYSYGILLMELFTGKSPTDDMFGENFGLHEYVKTSLPDAVNEIVDPLAIDENLDSHVKTDKLTVCLASILQIGVKCSAHEPQERLDSYQVLTKLGKIRDMLLKVKKGRT